jgi:hypothetical protein
MLFGLLGPPVMAQQTISSDSIYLYEQTNRQQEWAHYSSTQLLFRDFRNVARSQLYGGREQGSFHRSQEAYQQTVAGFHTDGVKTLGRFTLAGQFDFEKRWEDSAAWWNGGEYNEAQPYYFFAGKAGKYEKQLYNLSATAAYNLWKNKLYLGMSGNYRYHWTTRSVDPRPDVKALTISLRPEITWRYKQHLAGAGFLWGRGSETNSIEYKNDGYASNQLYIERNHFMSLGFGYIGKLTRYMQRFNETSGFFANYATMFKNWELQASGGYELWQEDISMEQPSNRSHHDLYAFLQQDKSYGNLLLNHTGIKTRQQWELHFTTKSMLNRASEFNATSYQYTATEARFTYRQLWQKQNGISIELGAGCQYKEYFKEDIVAAHTHQLQVITPHVYGGIYRQAANKSWLSLRVTPSFRHSLTNELSVPITQENYFTQGVVYTDYLYWQNNSWSVATQFDFIQKEKPKQHRLGCTFKVKWEQAGEVAQSTLPALYMPSGSRWNATASINLYL